MPIIRTFWFPRKLPGNFQAQLGLALLNEKDKHYTEAYDGINNLIEQYPDWVQRLMQHVAVWRRSVVNWNLPENADLREGNFPR